MTFRNDFDRHIFHNRYLYLLITTVLEVFLNAFFPDHIFSLVRGITFTLFMLACINLIRDEKRTLVFMVVFTVVIMILVWMPDYSYLGKLVYPAEKLLAAVFYGTIIFHIIRQVTRSKKVSANVVFGVIAIYILYGLLAGDINLLIYFFDPDAFSGALDPADAADLRYFSYVTITTTGYGDITAVSQLARAAAVFFSLTSQLYLAVIIALIVGKYVSHSEKEKAGISGEKNEA